MDGLFMDRPHTYRYDIYPITYKWSVIMLYCIILNFSYY